MTGSEFGVSRFGRRRVGAAVLCGAVLLAAAGTSAEPFVPSDAEQVLERLPAREGADWQAIAALQVDLARTPHDAVRAAELAERYLTLFSRQGDPRLIAYAQRALSPWDAHASPPLDVALRRAQIAGMQHRFDAARAELERVLERFPRDGRAWLMLASIDVVRSDYANARRECSRLVLLEDAAVAGGCLAAVQAMSGEAGRAHELLEGRLRSGDLSPEIAAWLETLSAETAEALGRTEQAERSYRAALAAAAEPSVYLLAAYADFLLRADRAVDAMALLERAPPADSLLLRLALAEKRAGRDVAKRVEVLRYRLQLALDGLEAVHAREAAFFALYLLDEPGAALERALANWAEQREAIDARLVLEAALAANRSASALPVVEWLDANRIEHVDLRRLRASVAP
jgi:Tfp pilus assembly protein PilF